MTVLLNQNRVAAIFGEDVHPISDTPDDGGSDEDRLEFSRTNAREEFVTRRNAADRTIHLSPVGIPFDRNINEAEGRLPRRGHVGRHQDRAGAGPEQGALSGERDEWIQQVFLTNEFQHGRTFPSRNNEPFDEVEFLGATDENGVGAKRLQNPGVRVEVALER